MKYKYKKSQTSNQLSTIVLCALTFLWSNQIFSQLLTEKSELKRQLSQFSYFPNNPCEIQNEVQWNGKNKVVHFVRFESCQDDKTIFIVFTD